MNLQFQLANGAWANCRVTAPRAANPGDHTQEFIDRAVQKCIEITARIGAANLHSLDTHVATVVDTATATDALLAGKTLPTGTDWYNKLRAEPAPVAPRAPDPRPVLRCRKCGQTGHGGQYPFSTLPGSGRCDDCA